MSTQRCNRGLELLRYRRVNFIRKILPRGKLSPKAPPITPDLADVNVALIYAVKSRLDG